MNEIRYDLFRVTGKKDNLTLIKTFITSLCFRYICYFRLKKGSRFLRCFIYLFSHLLNRRVSIEIPSSVRIGKGILILHPYGITINSHAVIGDNFTIMKGATIGNTKSGKRPGSPIIGNNVYVGLNSTIVGGIHIGDNVLVAANTFINFDVPDDSVVIGSPGIVHKKENASHPYIINSIFDFQSKK